VLLSLKIITRALPLVSILSFGHNLTASVGLHTGTFNFE